MRSNGNPSPVEPLPPFGALPAAPKEKHARNRRLLRVFWWAFPLLLASALVGTAGLLLQLGAFRAWSDGDAGDWESAANKYTRISAVTRFGPARWVADYNRGTAALQLGDIPVGRAALEDALDGVPKATPNDLGKIQTFTYECQVRINLAVSWEASGDALREAGEAEAAIADYDRALELADPCQLSNAPEEASGSEGPTGETEEQADQGSSTSERIENKRDEAQREADGESQPEPEPSDGQTDSDSDAQDSETGEQDPFAGETEEEQQRREQLEQRNQDQAEREREKEEATNRNPGSRGW